MTGLFLPGNTCNKHCDVTRYGTLNFGHVFYYNRRQNKYCFFFEKTDKDWLKFILRNKHFNTSYTTNLQNHTETWYIFIHTYVSLLYLPFIVTAVIYIHEYYLKWLYQGESVKLNRRYTELLNVSVQFSKRVWLWWVRSTRHAEETLFCNHLSGIERSELYLIIRSFSNTVPCI